MTAPVPPRLKDVLAKHGSLTPYELGYITALSNFAIWRNGEQRIGAMQRTVAEEADAFLQGRIALVQVRNDAAELAEALKAVRPSVEYAADHELPGAIEAWENLDAALAAYEASRK